MVRATSIESNLVYRVVTTTTNKATDFSKTDVQGPYGTVGAARAQAAKINNAFEKDRADYPEGFRNIEKIAKVQYSETEWKDR